MSNRKTTANVGPVPMMRIESGQRTLRGQAYDILRRQLLSGELRPGERVNEVVMAAQLGISRGPLREAIRNLEQEGLLTAAPHRGTFVRQLTQEEAAELQEVRLALETAAACRLAQRFTPEARAMLEDRLAHLSALHADDSTLAERMSADLAFHEAICQASGNETLLTTWQSLIGRITIMVVNVGAQRMSQLQDADAHRPLLDAIASGKPQVIRETFARVFDSGTRVVLEAVSHSEAESLDVA
jgi:DNA-binding GntR family transcriptional regulator